MREKKARKRESEHHRPSKFRKTDSAPRLLASLLAFFFPCPAAQSTLSHSLYLVAVHWRGKERGRRGRGGGGEDPQTTYSLRIITGQLAADKRAAPGVPRSRIGRKNATRIRARSFSCAHERRALGEAPIERRRRRHGLREAAEARGARFDETNEREVVRKTPHSRSIARFFLRILLPASTPPDAPKRIHCAMQASLSIRRAPLQVCLIGGTAISPMRAPLFRLLSRSPTNTKNSITPSDPILPLPAQSFSLSGPRLLLLLIRPRPQGSCSSHHLPQERPLLFAPPRSRGRRLRPLRRCLLPARGLGRRRRRRPHDRAGKVS